MLDKETRDSIRYLVAIKKKEQIEKEIEAMKQEVREEELASKEKIKRISRYFNS